MPVKVGLIARAEYRGLGYLTWEFAQHVKPDRVLVVDLGPLARGFASDVSRFPGATVVPWVDGQVPEPDVRAWLDGLDVLYSAETFYDPRVAGWAREAGCRTVLHAMPEFFRPEMEPDVVWAPTGWRLDLLPPDARPVPVPVSVPALGEQPGSSILRVLHVAGHRAAQDRNGTAALATALRFTRGKLIARVECQDRRLPPIRGAGGVQVRVHLGGRPVRWSLYRDADLIVMPRRYGGLSLPVQEAMAAGLGVVMTDVEPNREWPIEPIPVAGRRSTLATPGGMIEVHPPDPHGLAEVLSRLAGDPAAVEALKAQAQRWVEGHTWEALEPLYRRELVLAADPARCARPGS